MNNEHPIKLYASITLSMLFFALSFVWFKMANRSYGPLSIVFLRLALSALMLFLFNFFSKKLVIPDKRDLKYLLLLALCEPFVYFLGESFALERISSTLAAVITSTIPIFALIVSFFLTRETISKQNICGILISVIGVLLVVYESNFEVGGSLFGILLQFMAVFSAVIYTLVLQKISKRMNTFSVVMFQNLFGCIYFLPLWLIFEMREMQATGFDLYPMLAILCLSLFASTIAFLLFVYSSRFLGVMKANTFINAIPVFTAIAAWFILGEDLSLQKFVGIVIVIIGVFLAQMKIQQKENAKLTKH